MKVTAKALLWTAWVLAIPSLTGCGGSASSPASSPMLMPRSASATLSDGLTATLTEDRATVAVGGTVNYTMTLTNSTAAPITYLPAFGPGVSSLSVPAYLEVLDSSGKSVYPVGASAQVVGIGPSVTVAPGQSLSVTQSVDTVQASDLTIAAGYTHAGQYTATAGFGISSAVPSNTQADKPLGPVGVVAQ